MHAEFSQGKEKYCRLYVVFKLIRQESGQKMTTSELSKTMWISCSNLSDSAKQDDLKSNVPEISHNYALDYSKYKLSGIYTDIYAF